MQIRSNGSQSSKRSIRGVLDFSGLFPGSGGSTKEAEAAPKMLDESESDSMPWSRPSLGLNYLPPLRPNRLFCRFPSNVTFCLCSSLNDSTNFFLLFSTLSDLDSGLGSSRSKEDPSFEELCEQTRMFEEVRVSADGHSNSGAGTALSGATASSGISGVNPIGILDETTQSSWSGFEGRRNGGSFAPFNSEIASPVTSIASSADSFAKVRFYYVFRCDLASL